MPSWTRTWWCRTAPPSAWTRTATGPAASRSPRAGSPPCPRGRWSAGYLLQAGQAGRRVRGEALPLLLEPDPAVVEPPRGTAAVTGDDLAAVPHHAVGELDRAVGRARAGQGAAADVAAGELPPDQVAVLVVAGHRRVR